ncbi:MAG: hypothetical protein V4850_27695 [Myxococcota bacterium]
MSTRSILCVPDGTNIRGVYHRFDSYPFELGNYLLLELLTRGGDMAGLVHELVEDAPDGWEWFPDRKRRTDSDDPPFFDRASLRRCGWVEYVYLFDVPGRRILAWNGNPWFDGPDAPAPDWIVTIGADGRAAPPVFEQPLPRWPRLAVAPEWEGDTPRSPRMRAVLEAALADTCEEAGVDADTVWETLRKGLLAAITEAVWAPAEAAGSAIEHTLRARLGLPRETQPPHEGAELELYVPFDFGVDDRYRELPLGRFVLRYPTPDDRSQRREAIRLYRGDGATTSLHDLSERVGAAWAPFEFAAAVAWFEAEVGTDDEGRIFVAHEVVLDNPGPYQIALAVARHHDPEINVGEKVFAALEFPSQWLLLDGLRARAGMEPDV